MDLKLAISEAPWNTEELLVWIVTRRLPRVRAPGAWNEYKAEFPDHAAQAEGDLLQLLRAGSTLNRAAEIPRFNSAPRKPDDNQVSQRLALWTDCFADRHARYDPSRAKSMFPDQVARHPVSDGVRIPLFQLTRWLSDRISFKMRRHAHQLTQLQALLKISNLPNSPLLVRGWPTKRFDDEAQIVPMEVTRKLEEEPSVVRRGGGYEGSAVSEEGTAIINGRRWFRLHFLEHEVTDYFADFDGSLALNAYAQWHGLRIVERRYASQDEPKPRKRGRPREYDIPWLKLVHQLWKSGAATSVSNAALKVAFQYEKAIPGGGSAPSKGDRLRKAYNALSESDREFYLGE